MEKTELTVSMEPERLDALRYFLAAKNKRTPQKELQRALEELYEAYVPAETRAYPVSYTHLKDLIHANSSVKDALLFNLLSYLSDQLLTKGNTVAALDELYLWLSNLTTIEYIRNCLKRVRKRNSALILSSQNLEDFDIQGVRELTRPLFAIPTHQFLFHGGKVDKKFYMDNLQLESAEYDLISSPNNGVCLFKSGADRNLLDVHAPPHKHALITGGDG